MKFCKDCMYSVFSYVNQEGGRELRCIHGLKKIIDPVYGYAYYPVVHDCEAERKNNTDDCEEVALHYKRKWWKFWRPK